MPAVLNVGGGSKSIAIPAHYQGWAHILLDIDKAAHPDFVGDARYLERIFESGRFDAVYCSHNLEHYYPHDGAKVLSGFRYVLKPDGFTEIRVPDVGAVIRAVVERNLDLEDELYISAIGPIRVLDIIYGLQDEIRRSGKDFYAHRTGFTARTLQMALRRAGFEVIAFGPPLGGYELRAIAFKQSPTSKQRQLLGMPV